MVLRTLYSWLTRQRSRLPSLDTRKWIGLAKLLLAILCIPIGISVGVAGLVLVPALALAGQYVLTVAAGFLLGFGLTACVGAYLWLTGEL